MTQMVPASERAPLRCARAFGREEGILFLLTRHLFLSAQARLGNVPGYYRTSLPGLEYRGWGIVPLVG